MSTTENEEATLNGIPMSVVMQFLSERGQVELELAVAKAQVAIQNDHIQKMNDQLTTLDAQVVAMMEEKHGVRTGHAAAAGTVHQEQVGSNGAGALRADADNGG